MSDNLFTYKRLSRDIWPATLDNVLKAYPRPKNEKGQAYSYVSHYKVPLEYISTEFADIIKQGNMEVVQMEVFYRPGTGEEFDAGIHSDGAEVAGNLAKINFVIGGENNTTTWYIPKVEISPDNVIVTPVGTKYLKFEPDQVEILDQADINGLYIFNGGIPHGVKMVGGSIDKPRICISVVPKIIGAASSLTSCHDVYLRFLFGMFKTNHITLDEFKNEYKNNLNWPLRDDTKEIFKDYLK